MEKQESNNALSNFSTASTATDYNQLRGTDSEGKVSSHTNGVVSTRVNCVRQTNPHLRVGPRFFGRSWHNQRSHYSTSGWSTGNQSGLPCFGTPLIWKQNLYVAAGHDVTKMFSLSTVTGMLSVRPVNKGSFVYNWPGANPVISSNGNNNGVVWTVDLATKSLRANDASDISKILYINSNFGTAVNWMVPTVINGHVYIGLKDEIIAYSMH